jgi:hypothetical protein
MQVTYLIASYSIALSYLGSQTAESTMLELCIQIHAYSFKISK